MKKHLLPQSGAYYKAGMHLHTTVSDGCLPPEETKKAFHIPETQEVFALLPLGYPAEESKPSGMHDSRKPLEETVVRL